MNSDCSCGDCGDCGDCGGCNTGSDKFITLNPANEEVLAEVTYCRKPEVDRAVAAAQEAFYGGAWSKIGGYERGRLLNRLADLIEKHKEELIMLEVMDNGKSIAEATAADMNLVLQCYRYYAVSNRFESNGCVEIGVLLVEPIYLFSSLRSFSSHPTARDGPIKFMGQWCLHQVQSLAETTMVWWRRSLLVLLVKLFHGTSLCSCKLGN